MEEIITRKIPVGDVGQPVPIDLPGGHCGEMLTGSSRKQRLTHRRSRVGVAAALMWAAVAVGAAEPHASHDAVSTPVLAIDGGQVTGIPSPFTGSGDARVVVYSGLPYAAPPVGEGRWRPPAPAAEWQGVRSADTFSDSCYQARHTSTFVWRREDFPVSEDCLYLNVWTPDAGQNLPVMVWFHGGAHTSGQGHSLIFDGTELASHGVVLITINYRLGPFGFLAHPLLAAESPEGSAGNYGLLDKIAALQWVQSNVGAFGGDANNVTVFGQSAGSQSVCALMAAPLARGLFHKAIGQSAACVNTIPDTDANGFARGERLVKDLALSSTQAMRSAPAETLLASALSTGWESESRITVDGWVLPEHPLTTFREGRQAPVPLMLGFLADEGVELFPKNPALSAAELDAFLQQIAGPRAQDLKSQYIDEYSSPGDLQHAVATDFFMAFGMRRWAEYQAAIDQPTFFYFMDHVPPAFHLYMPEQTELDLPEGPRSGGAYHSGDLAFVFGNTDKVGLDWNDADRALSRHMVRYWLQFAQSGDPNGSSLPAWRPFDRLNRWTQVLNSAPRATAGVRASRLDIMAAQWPQ